MSGLGDWPDLLGGDSNGHAPIMQTGRQCMQLSILVIDLVGYSERLAALDEQVENAAETLNRQIEDFVGTAIAQAGLTLEATLLKFTGDGAILKAPNPERAHRIAMALQGASAEFNRSKQTELGKRVFRVGMATGEVAPYESASGSRDFGGPTIGRAARMEAGCERGGVMIDEASFQHLPPDLRSLYHGPEMLVDKNKMSYPAYRYPGTAKSAMPNLATEPKVAEPLHDSALLADFEEVMKSLFKDGSVLYRWPRLPRSPAAVLPQKVVAEISRRDRSLGERLTGLICYDITSPLLEDLQTARFSLTLAERKRATQSLVQGMDVAVVLCMDHQQRQQLIALQKGLLQVPAQLIEGAQIALRDRATDAFDIQPNSLNRAMRAKHTASLGLEMGVGQDEQYGLASLICSIPSSRNPQGLAVTLSRDQPNETSLWRGFLHDERRRGRGRLLVLGAKQADALSNATIQWLENFGVRVVLLAGDNSAFWWVDEALLVAQVAGFIEDVNRILEMSHE